MPMIIYREHFFVGKHHRNLMNSDRSTFFAHEDYAKLEGLLTQFVNSNDNIADLNVN
jgi:hypothetical protein